MHALLVSPLTALLAAAASAPSAGAPIIEAGVVQVEVEGRPWRLEDCSALDALRLGDVLYVACGFDGVFEYVLGPGGPQRVAVRSVLGRAVLLFERGGAVWVEIERREAVALGSVRPSAVRSSSVAAQPRPSLAPPATASPPRPPSPPAPAGQVLMVDDLDVTISLGDKSGIQMGDRIEILGTSRPTIVGRVEQIADETAVVGVGQGEPVEVGARARKADRAPVTRSIVAPPRQSGLFELNTELVSFLPISTLGLGTLTSLGVTYRFVLPIVIRAQIEPLGLSGSDDGNVFSIAGWASLGLDTQLFELALGAGGATVNERDFNSVAKSAITLVPSIRVGARDGLNLTAVSGTQIYDDAFNFGFLHVGAQIPLSTRFALRLRGGGGRVGHIFGDLGVRYLLRGNGGHDSLFLTGSLGGVRVAFETRCTLIDQTCATTELAGPSLGVGLEWRP